MDNCIISPKTHMYLPDRQLIMTYLQCFSVKILIKKIIIIYNITNKLYDKFRLFEIYCRHIFY